MGLFTNGNRLMLAYQNRSWANDLLFKSKTAGVIGEIYRNLGMSPPHINAANARVLVHQLSSVMRLAVKTMGFVPTGSFDRRKGSRRNSGQRRLGQAAAPAAAGPRRSDRRRVDRRLPSY